MMPVQRCGWAQGSELMAAYHDAEWGVPVRDDRKHFEFIVLESAQAGLSWLTILKRREGYRQAFANFDPAAVAKFDEARVEALMQDASIIRNRRKIEATIQNARAFLQIQAEFGSFDAYVWAFIGGKPVVNHWTDMSQVPAVTPLAVALSKDLVKRGFKFVGPTIIYAHMQATGLVNDHTTDCFRHKELA